MIACARARWPPKMAGRMRLIACACARWPRRNSFRLRTVQCRSVLWGLYYSVRWRRPMGEKKPFCFLDPRQGVVPLHVTAPAHCSRRDVSPHDCPRALLSDGGIIKHRRSWWLLSCTEAPPVPFRRVLPSLLAVPSLACSVASLSLCPGGYLPDQHPLQSTGLAGCQIAWDTSSTWSGKHAQELQLLHLLVLCDRCQLELHRYAHARRAQLQEA